MERHPLKPRTIALINIASILEKADEQILPALYSRIGASFDATPTQLGYITLGRAMMQAFASPFGAIGSQFLPRPHVIAAGCLTWSLFTALFSITSSLWVAMPIAAMNGVGLALVIPNVQSLTADFYPSSARGRAFGALWLTICFGGMLGALYATNMGAYQPLGIDGWRFVFFSVSCLSCIAGVLNYCFSYDPTWKKPEPHHHSEHTWSTSQMGVTLRCTARQIMDVMRIPTFSIIILQGVVGSVPYASLVFLTLYLQLAGMDNFTVSALVALYLASGGVGGLLGGWVGDKAAQMYPNHGRILVTQFSVLIGIPLATLLFRGLPLSGDGYAVMLHAVVIFAFALLTSWPAPACNNPVFAEIVPPNQRNLVYAFDRCFEGAVAAFATPFVGLLAEKWYGFAGTSTITGQRDVDGHNCKALGSALVMFLTVPWFFCLLVYGGLHFTYPSDRRAAAVAAKQWEEEEHIVEFETVQSTGNEEEEAHSLIRESSASRIQIQRERGRNN